jgi:hypothetical protein
MLAFDHPITDETRLPISRASARLIERLATARDALHDLRESVASAAGWRGVTRFGGSLSAGGASPRVDGGIAPTIA